MKSKFGIVLTTLWIAALMFGLLLLASSAFAQESLLGDLQVARAHYPTPMSAAQIGQLLNEVAWSHVNDGWRLLAKPNGNHCPAPSGQFIACDYLVWMNTGQGYDVLIDQEGAGKPSWQVGDRFTSDRFLMPVAPDGVPSIPPVVVPPVVAGPPPIINIPPPQIIDLSGVLAAIKDVRDAQERIYADDTNQRKDQTTAIVAAVNNPGWFTSLMSNRYVQLALVGVATYVTTHQMTKP